MNLYLHLYLSLALALGMSLRRVCVPLRWPTSSLSRSLSGYVCVCVSRSPSRCGPEWLLSRAHRQEPGPGGLGCDHGWLPPGILNLGFDPVCFAQRFVRDVPTLCLVPRIRLSLSPFPAFPLLPLLSFLRTRRLHAHLLVVLVGVCVAMPWPMFGFKGRDGPSAQRNQHATAVALLQRRVCLPGDIGNIRVGVGVGGRRCDGEFGLAQLPCRSPSSLQEQPPAPLPKRTPN